MGRRRTMKILPTNRYPFFIGGLHLRSLRRRMSGEVTEDFAYPEGGFMTLAALEREDGSTLLYLRDDDDIFIDLDEGKPYDVYVRYITNLVLVPQPRWYPTPDVCPVTGIRWYS